MFRAQKPHAWGAVIESVRLALQASVSRGASPQATLNGAGGAPEACRCHIV
jgi:hypothetical protein